MTSKTYDRLWSETWGHQQRFGPVHRRQRDQLLKLIASLDIRTVLDVGCGSGDNLAELAEGMPHLTLSGVDVSEEALSQAAKRVSRANFRQLDVQKQALDEKFDLVLCCQVVEHLMDDIAALRHMSAMAARWVLVTTMRGRMRRSEHAIGHIRNYSDVELRVKAEAAGLEVVDIFGWGFPFYSPLYRTMIEWLPGGPPANRFSRVQIAVANFLYYLYGLNLPRRGDVVTMLARPLRNTV